MKKVIFGKKISKNNCPGKGNSTGWIAQKTIVLNPK